MSGRDGAEKVTNETKKNDHELGHRACGGIHSLRNYANGLKLDA